MPAPSSSDGYLLMRAMRNTMTIKVEATKKI
jgi:hypothetical protein